MHVVAFPAPVIAPHRINPVGTQLTLVKTRGRDEPAEELRDSVLEIIEDALNLFYDKVTINVEGAKIRQIHNWNARIRIRCNVAFCMGFRREAYVLVDYQDTIEGLVATHCIFHTQDGVVRLSFADDLPF